MGYVKGPDTQVGPTAMHRDYIAHNAPERMVLARRLWSPNGGFTRIRRGTLWVDIWKPRDVAMYMFRGAMLSKHQAVVHRRYEEEDTGTALAKDGYSSYTIVLDVMLESLFRTNVDQLKQHFVEVLQHCGWQQVVELIEEVERRLGVQDVRSVGESFSGKSEKK